MFRLFLALALMTAPALAQTADQEARLADAVAAMEAQSFSFYASIDPRFVPILTPPEDLGANVPEVMMSDVVFAASSECGSLSYSTSKMVTPEFLALMDEPEVMNALMGQAR